MGEVIASLTVFFLLAIFGLVFSIGRTLFGPPMIYTMKDVGISEPPARYRLLVRTQVRIQSELLSSFENCSVVNLTKDKIVFGRDQEVDVTLDDPRVSRQHFQIVWTERGYELTDLDSTNGTYVNDTRIEGSCILRIGDIIRTGRFEAVFERK